MAIVITTNPGSYYSAHGDLIFVVYEATKALDPVTYPDYKYVADVYIGAVLVARIKKVPQPDTKMGIFSLGNVIRDYVSSVFNPAANVIKAQESGTGEFFTTVTIKFGEEYSFTLYTNLTVDSARIYFNHYNGRMVGQNTLLGNYQNAIVSVRPTITPVNSSDAFTLIPYFAVSASAFNYLIKAYTDSGNLLATISNSITPAAANNLIILNVSPTVLNTVTAGFLNAASYYTVQANSGTIYRLNLTCEAQYDVYTLHFLNRFGGFESRNFTKVSRKVIDIVKTDFGKLPYTIDSSGALTYYNSNRVYNETRSTYASQYKEKMTLNTDILTDNEYTWLGDLIISPLVYLEMAGGYFIPVAITQNNYEFKKIINDDLTNLTIDIEFGDQFNAQYR